MEQNHLYNFGRGHYREPSCEIILNLDMCFRRRCCLKEKFMHDERTDARQRPIIIAHLEPSAEVS